MCLFKVCSTHHSQYTVRTDQCSTVNMLFGSLWLHENCICNGFFSEAAVLSRCWHKELSQSVVCIPKVCWNRQRITYLVSCKCCRYHGIFPLNIIHLKNNVNVLWMYLMQKPYTCLFWKRGMLKCNESLYIDYFRGHIGTMLILC